MVFDVLGREPTYLIIFAVFCIQHWFFAFDLLQQLLSFAMRVLWHAWLRRSGGHLPLLWSMWGPSLSGWGSSVSAGTAFAGPFVWHAAENIRAPEGGRGHATHHHHISIRSQGRGVGHCSASRTSRTSRWRSCRSWSLCPSGFGSNLQHANLARGSRSGKAYIYIYIL